MILNLTQHAATPEQLAAGVQDLEGTDLVLLKNLLTFETLPHVQDIRRRALRLAKLAKQKGAVQVMIGGAPYLMHALVQELNEHHIVALFAFSERQSVEEPQADGSVRKVNVFKHTGFVDLLHVLHW